MINLKRLIQSFVNALTGARVVFKSEQSFRIQILAAIVILVFSVWFKITSYEWIILLLLIGIILSLELINSVFERIMDSFKPRIHPIVRDIKDIMAASVLIMSIIAVLIGITVFWPHLIALVLR